MTKKKILTVVGARPQFIKAAAISKIIKRKNLLNEVIVHTGQHYDNNMSKIFFKKLKIKKPKYFLKVKNLTHNLMISKMINRLDKIYEKEKPDGLIVYGDTNSSLSAAISAKKRMIPVFHIESGVRNQDETMPEESNRYLIDRVSSINFCATELNFKNLIREGFGTDSIKSKIFKSGDVMYDLFLNFKNKRKKKLFNKKEILKKNKSIICTIHRESNIKNINNLKNIILALNELNIDNSVILIAHPRTKKKILEKKIFCNFKIYDPIDYEKMMNYILESKLVITDSGGLVREAYFAKKKSLFILEHPVWPEIIEQGYCLNAPPNKSKILNAYKNLLKPIRKFKKNIFGNGKASSLIVSQINKYLN